MKNKKGFTLIELLAIIVILAIIAVITVPIILNIIENSKKGAIQNSAYGFKDAIYQYYINDVITNDEAKLNGKYSIRNGILNGPNADNTEILVSGTKPSSGYLTYSNNTLVKGCLVIDEYEVVYNNEQFTVNGTGNCIVKIDTANMTIGLKDENIQYYTGGNGSEPDNVVYFDPINGIYNCEEYHEDNSIVRFNGVITGDNSTKTTNNQTSCLKWFLYSVDDKGTEDETDDVANMILDHNTTKAIEWYTAQINYRGPSEEFLAKLNSDTNNWSSNKILPPKPYNVEWEYDQNKDKSISEDEEFNYSIAYTNYKARIIEAEEVAKAKGYTSEQWTIYANSINLIPDFLYKNLSNSNNILGYWTSSPNPSKKYVYYIDYNGLLSFSYASNPQYIGIRPVISIMINDTL